MSPRPLAEYWRPLGETAWRHVDADPPPDPPEEVEWLRRRPEEGQSAYRSRAETGALPSYVGAQAPDQP